MALCQACAGIFNSPGRQWDTTRVHFHGPHLPSLRVLKHHAESYSCQLCYLIWSNFSERQKVDLVPDSDFETAGGPGTWYNLWIVYLDKEEVTLIFSLPSLEDRWILVWKLVPLSTLDGMWSLGSTLSVRA